MITKLRKQTRRRKQEPNQRIGKSTVRCGGVLRSAARLDRPNREETQPGIHAPQSRSTKVVLNGT